MNLIILGPQGSGKGTQAEKLAEKFKLEHIDMGKFLREVAALGTPLGKEIHEIINVKKELVSDKILKEAIHLKLMGLPREQGIVFDGVPRSQGQLEYFEGAMEEAGRQIDAVVLINLSEKESIERISKRRVCQKCKKVYILGRDKEVDEGKCDCGGEVAIRIDDAPEGVVKRLGIFKKETLPVVEYFRRQDKLVEIDGDQTIDEVYGDIIEKLESVE
jgi:adenylate kinase